MRIKKILIVTICIILTACIVIPIMFVILGIESNPRVVQMEKLTVDDITRAKQLAQENDPRKLPTGVDKRIFITKRDVNLFLNYAVSRMPHAQNLNARIDLFLQSVHVHCTIKIPNNLFGNYLNLSAEIGGTAKDISINKLRIGAIAIPGWLLRPFEQFAHHKLLQYEEYRLFLKAWQVIKNIEVNENQVIVTYRLQQDTLDQLQAHGQKLLLSMKERERLLVYNRKLVRVARSQRSRNVSLTNFLQPLFQLALERTSSGCEPVAEIRALILTLTMYSIQKSLNSILSSENGKGFQQPRQVNLTLRGRSDLAKHFLVSATIAVAAGTGLADLVGLFKEMEDSRGGSGFSFADLAADRAGVKLGEMAISSSQQAKLIRQMSEVTAENEYMPRINQLPEGILELEFKKKYKDLDSAAYRLVRNEVEHRIAACRFYR